MTTRSNWSGTSDMKRGDQQRVIVHQAVAADDDLDHAFHHLPATFDLQRDVPCVGHPVQDGIEATVEQRQVDMQSAL